MKLRILLLTALLLAAACSKPSPPAATPAADRPASTATLTIVEPATGASIPAPTVHVKLQLDGGRIVEQTTTNLKPDEGHIHVKLDGSLVSMNYALEQDLTAAAGAHLLEVEFVAADHAPFHPRVIQSTTFTVT